MEIQHYQSIEHKYLCDLVVSMIWSTGTVKSGYAQSEASLQILRKEIDISTFQITLEKAQDPSTSCSEKNLSYLSDGILHLSDEFYYSLDDLPCLSIEMLHILDVEKDLICIDATYFKVLKHVKSSSYY